MAFTRSGTKGRREESLPFETGERRGKVCKDRWLCCLLPNQKLYPHKIPKLELDEKLWEISNAKLSAEIH